LSVVVPTLDATPSLGPTLASLVPGLGAGLIRELVLADGGSADGVEALAEGTGARLVRAQRGRGTQLRAGAEATSGPWLLFLHADTRLSPHWPEAAAAHMAGAPERAGWFRLRFDHSGWAAGWTAGWANRRAALGLPFGDQGLLIRRALYEAVGGHPPQPIMEDVALARALGRARLAPLAATATTSAERYRREGWTRRGARNVACQALWALGAPPERIARLYAGAPNLAPGGPGRQAAGRGRAGGDEMSVQPIRAGSHGAERPDAAEEARRDLAAAFRWAVRERWHESVQNHFSLATDPEGRRFLINPKLRHFSRITASSLVEIDADDPETMRRPDAPEATAWGLHGSLHRRVPWARCALHLHPKYATVLASLSDSAPPAIDQNSAIFHNRVAVDAGYGGLAFEAEGERVAALLLESGKRMMMMGNHGVMALGETVAEAFDRLYYFERAARTVVLAYMTGRPLRRLSDEVAERVAAAAEADREGAEAHLREIRAILDVEEPDYRS
jgi:rSAM/selenodomain-associated transferase 2